MYQFEVSISNNHVEYIYQFEVSISNNSVEYVSV